jgi:large subunit ribosomal protein L22
MEVKASLKHLRISPRKTRLVAGVIRGLEVNKAVNQLKFLNKKSAKPMLKLVQSAISSAVNNYELDKNNLIIKEVRVEDGKTLKRWMPRAHGRATVIRKRMSHIYLILSEIVDSGKKEAKKVKVEEPVKLDDLAKKPKSDKKEKVSKDDKALATKKVKTEKEEEKGVEIVDPRGHGKGKNTKIEGKSSSKSFASKVFRRKAG